MCSTARAARNPAYYDVHRPRPLRIAFASIPTFAELGCPKLAGSQGFGLPAPKGLRAPIVQRLTALIPQIVSRPDFVARLEAKQTLPRKTFVIRSEFVQLINSQIDTWRSVAKLANVGVIT